jgi:hypothetical protein
LPSNGEEVGGRISSVNFDENAKKGRISNGISWITLLKPSTITVNRGSYPRKDTALKPSRQREEILKEAYPKVFMDNAETNTKRVSARKTNPTVCTNNVLSQEEAPGQTNDVCAGQRKWRNRGEQRML